MGEALGKTHFGNKNGGAEAFKNNTYFRGYF
jgi:hypothetical protein